MAKSARKIARGPVRPSLQGLHHGRQAAARDEIPRVGLAGGKAFFRDQLRESEWIVGRSVTVSFMEIAEFVDNSQSRKKSIQLGPNESQNAVIAARPNRNTWLSGAKL